MTATCSKTLFQTTDVFAANVAAIDKYKVIVNQGGTYSTKTYSILQVLFKTAFQCKRFKHKIITVVGQDIPNLKVGALRDAQNIVGSSDLLKAAIKSYNKSDRFYEFHNGFIIEFKSYDDWQDAKSGKRDYLFINEVNGVPMKVYEQLALRTEFNVFLDYNPDAEFWVHQQVIGKDGVVQIISDHRHNTFLSEDQHNRIESIDDPELWKVYARGMTGKLEGVIFRYAVKELPKDSNGVITAKKIGTGLDFGFTNDPTACIDVWEAGGELYLDELFYERGLTNVPVQGVSHPNINDKLIESGISKYDDIVADSAEQKSIRELEQMGWFIKPAIKGPDSVKQGIDIMKRYKLNVTPSSSNLKKEFNSYKWKQDKGGILMNVPVDFMNHGIDAVRYVCLNKLAKQGEQDWDDVFL